MESEEIATAIGKLQGTVESNHKETLKRFDDQGKEIKDLQQIHWKQKGMMSTISLFITVMFHAIIEGLKTHLR